MRRGGAAHWVGIENDSSMLLVTGRVTLLTPSETLPKQMKIYFMTQSSLYI
jgi:hypothetical protein